MSSSAKGGVRSLLSRFFDSWPAQGVLATLLAIGSTWLLRLATKADPLWPVLWRVLAGAILGAAALYFAWRVLRKVSNPGRWAARLLTIGCIGTSFGLYLLNPVIAPLGLVVVMVGLIAGYEWLLKGSNSDDATFAGTVRRFFETPIAPVVGVALAVIGGVMLSSKVAFGFALPVAFIGLVFVKIGTTRYLGAVPQSTPQEWEDRVSHRGKWVLASSAVASVIGFVLMRTEQRAPLGVVLLICALSAGSLAAYHLAPIAPRPLNDSSPTRNDSTRWWIVAVVGQDIAIAGIIWTHSVLGQWQGLAWTVAAVTLLVGIFFVFRGEGIVMLVLIGFVLAWVLVDRTERPIELEPAGSGVIVAFGDSFMSGQGTNRYLPGTNTQADADGNSCRRSPVSFAYLVGQDLQREVLNFGCNGAKLEHITLVGQHKRDPWVDEADADREPQLDMLAYNLPEKIDLVLLTAGGNDAQFSTLASACALPSNCVDAQDLFTTEIGLIEFELQRTIAAIRAEIESGPPIVVVPYPDYIGEGKCRLSISTEEVKFARDFIQKLNQMIHFAVSEMPLDDDVHFFPHIDRAYEGRRLCETDGAAANFIRLVPQEGSILDRLNPTSWHGSTMHPNDIGHACTAAVLGPWLESEFPDLEGASGPVATCPDLEIRPFPSSDDLETPTRPDTQQAPLRSIVCDDIDTNAELRDSFETLCADVSNSDGTVRPGIECVYGGETKGLELDCKIGRQCVSGEDAFADPDGCFDEDEWVNGELTETLRRLAVPLTLVLLGGIIGALGIARAWRDGWILLPFLPDPPGHSATRRESRRTESSPLAVVQSRIATWRQGSD